MTSTARALYQFFSSFGLPAYVENNVPDEAELPYITYEAVYPYWRDTAQLTARVWYYSSSYVEIYGKVDEISRAVNEGISLPTDDGSLWLFKGTPWAQNQPTDETDLKAVYLTFVIHALTN